jgi:hypothetical protein
MTELERVVRWEPVGPSWLGHRPEPLIHERTWACPQIGLPAGDPWRFDAGFDSDGGALARRVTSPDPAHDGGSFIEVAVVGDRCVDMSLDGGVVTLHVELDGDGRPIRTVYEGEAEGEEHYRYDDLGRLVTIEEAEDLSMTTAGARTETGGTLSVEHDDDGPLRIAAADELVWERSSEPWPGILAAGAAAIRDRIAAATAQACEQAGIDPATEVFSLMLMYVSDGGLYAHTCFGMQADRDRWLAGDLDQHQLSCNLWEPEPAGPDTPLYLLDSEMLDDMQERLLLRDAATSQPEEPQRVVLNAAAGLLARHDWTGLLTPTTDFVVYIAEHDEGWAPKHASVRAVNPPDRIAAWDAGWPARASRGEDECSG